MRRVLCGRVRGARPRLPSEHANLHFCLALFEVEHTTLTGFPYEERSPVGPNFVAIDDFRCCQVVRGALLIVRCHFLTPCFEAAGAPLSRSLRAARARLRSDSARALPTTDLGCKPAATVTGQAVLD